MGLIKRFSKAPSVAAEHKVEFLFRPGRKMGDEPLAALHEEICAVAMTCFDGPLPDYQCLRGTREEYADKIITLARREDGRLDGFCSAVLLDVEGVGEVLHTGLTCVRPDARSGGLTHKLLSKVVFTYLLRYHPVGRTWVTNCACVLSSLGNIALHFDEVYPAPESAGATPSEVHLRIARAIDAHYRDKIYIDAGARLNTETFVFEGSVPLTVFQKDAGDERFHHRNAEINDFYKNLMVWERGDEVLQIGHFSIMTGLRYILGRKKKAGKAPRKTPALAAEAA